MKNLFCILGRSACGKDTLVKNICDEWHMSYIKSHTTRLPRHMEENTHIFSTINDFIKDYDEDNIAAYTLINNSYYWTTFDQLENCDFYVIDPNGLSMLKNKIFTQNNIRLITIYITAPSDERRKRALLRDPNCEETYNDRIKSEDLQFLIYEREHNYDYCINNVHFEGAYEQLKVIVKKENERIYAF